jgi:hypothetical protein
VDRLLREDERPLVRRANGLTITIPNVNIDRVTNRLANAIADAVRDERRDSDGEPAYTFTLTVGPDPDPA